MSWYITLFGKNIPLYGICFWAGILICTLLAVLLCKRRGMERYDLIYAAVFAMIGAMVGSKLLFIIVSLEDLIRLKISFVGMIRGGFVFYGGLLGGGLGIFIYARYFKMNVWDFFDVCAVVVPLGHAMGRVGCFFAGCCYGIPYDGLFSYTYHSAAGQTPLGIPLLPIQLIEAFFLLILFLGGLAVYLKNSKAVGCNTCIYLTAYSVLRFVLEFFRGDRERGVFWCLSTSQWISLALLLCTLGVLLYRYRCHRTAPCTRDP